MEKMRIVLDRFGFGADSTLGRLIVPGVKMCFSLEDERREKKVWGETCIPTGTYDIELRKAGKFHQRYYQRFPWHKGVLWLRDVPNFEYILIHLGNDDDDTAGCIIPGEVPYVTPEGEFKVGRSADAYSRIYPVIADAVEREGVQIEVRETPSQ